MGGSTGGSTGGGSVRPSAATIALGLALLFGLAVAGGSVFSGRGTEASTSDALPYALVGAGFAVAIVALAYLVAREYAPSLRSPGWGPALTSVFLAAAIGALLGTALTPPTPEPEEVSPLTDDEIERRSESLELDPDTVVRPLDLDGDGEIDLDAEGNPLFGYDEDGDGSIDGYLQPCPNIPTMRAFRSAPRTILPDDRQPLDVECDGEIDGYLEFDPRPFTPGADGELAAPPPPPPAAPPATIAPEERAERADEQGAGGQFARTLLIGLLVLAAVALLAALFVWWARRNPGDDDDDEAADVPAAPAPDVAQSIRATIDVMERDVDPRQAICEAYGELLDQLAGVGLRRRPEEAPAEHIGRCLRQADLDEASVSGLLDLFLLARFSTHPVTEAHRQAAVQHLRGAMPAGSSEPMATATAEPMATATAAPMSGPMSGPPSSPDPPGSTESR